MKYALVLLMLINTQSILKAQMNFNSSNESVQGTMQVKGKVLDAVTGEPIIGANVIIKGSTRGSTTDIDGLFVLDNVPKGTLTISISYISYKPFEQTYTISDESNLNLEIVLEENVVAMQAVNVVSTRVTDSEISMMQTIKQNTLLVNGIPSQLIKKTQDRDAGEVVKRIPGITIQDGRFIIIRGLSERYNSVWLNSLPAPSAEADVRAFSFDLVPAAMIDNIVVYKTFSPELPGDFAGGLVQISTISNPVHNYIQASYANSYNENATGRQHLLYPVSKGGLWNNSSALNLASGFSENIAAIPTTAEGKDERTLIGQSMNKLWTPQSIVAPSDQRLSISGGWSKTIGKYKLANISMLNYSTTFSNNEIFRAAYNCYDEVNERPDTNYNFNDTQYNNAVKIGAMMNWAIISGNNKIEFRNMLNSQSTNRVTERSGKDYYGGLQLKGLEMSLKNRLMYSGQLSGSHTFGKKESQLKWFAGYSLVRQNMPDTKRLTWVLNDQSDSPYYEQYGLNFSFSANPNLSGRIFHELNESVINAGADFSSTLALGDFKLTYKGGFLIEQRQRTFSARNLGYKIAKTSQFDWNLPYQSIEEVFSNENINSTNGIMLDESTNPSDSYESSSSLYAGFLVVTIPIGSRLKIYGGVRAEQSHTELNSWKTDATNPPSDDDAVHYVSDTLLLLPAINISFNVSERSIIRTAYGITVNRPEYREIAPMAFYDYEMKAVISGNDSLTFARIHNFDIRYEYYPNAFSMFSFGAFYKQFTNAIEYKVIPTGSGLQYSFQNTPLAKVSGIEAEIRLGAAGISNNTSNRLIKNLVFVFNGAYMISSISFGDQSLEEDRALQGQSPYVLNAGLFWQSDSTGLTAAIMYNVAGKRIVFAGDPYSGNPHIYEMPSQQIDFSFSKKLGKHIEIKGNVRNILARDVRYVQNIETNKGMIEQTTMQYNPGRSYTLGLVWKL